jgi:1-acyl-sn-glycerol-3-phosphate acyltransferase
MSWKPYKTDVFGNANFLKRTLIVTLGLWSYFRFRFKYKVKLEGMEVLEKLPPQGVLFVSNHQTYFSEVILMYHAFFLIKNKRRKLNRIWHVFNPKLNIYFIAAIETMKAGILPKLFAYAGSISIKRTWREAGKNVNRQVNLRDISNIGTALDDGWVITFPQGTTTPYVKARRGTTHIIKKFEPIVIPVVVDGFRRAFDKSGIKKKKKGVTLRLTFKPPLEVDYQQDSNEMLDTLMDVIEQSERFEKAHLK